MISGHFGLNFVLPMPVIRAYVLLPGLTTDYAPIDFLLDTGSTHTCVHPHDAKMRLQIDPSRLADPRQWPRLLSTTGIGGTAVGYAWPAVYQFVHDDGSVRQIRPQIEIARPNATNATLPSLLGMNILRQFRVFVDYVGLQVTLQ